MNSWVFYSSLLAVNIVIHLLRLPRLIIENGGGAFLIIFFLSLHAIALPMLFSEVAFVRKLVKTPFHKLVQINKVSGVSSWMIWMIYAFSYLHVLMLLGLFCLFIYMTAVSLHYLVYFAKIPMGADDFSVEFNVLPDLSYSILGILLITGSVYFILRFFYKRFIQISVQWFLPFCFATLFFVFVRILLSINDFEGLKVLFYPDFLSITRETIIFAIGHSLICMLVGLGLFAHKVLLEDKRDPVQVVIHSVIQTIVATLFIGVIALPMIQQSNETPFGSSWVFEILPRWLSYSEFGFYYCFLFYLAISFLSFYLSIFIGQQSIERTALLIGHRFKNIRGVFVSIGFLLVLLGTVVFYRQNLKNWWGQGVFVNMDNFYVNIMLPTLCCFFSWFLFKFSTRKERQSLFSQQDVFFHSRYFFLTWEKVTLYMVPAIIVISWILLF